MTSLTPQIEQRLQELEKNAWKPSPNLNPGYKVVDLADVREILQEALEEKYLMHELNTKTGERKIHCPKCGPVTLLPHQIPGAEEKKEEPHICPNCRKHQTKAKEVYCLACLTPFRKKEPVPEGKSAMETYLDLNDEEKGKLVQKAIDAANREQWDEFNNMNEETEIERKNWEGGNWREELHKILQEEIAAEVWYESNGAEKRLEKCLKRAEEKLSKFCQAQSLRHEKERKEELRNIGQMVEHGTPKEEIENYILAILNNPHENN